MQCTLYILYIYTSQWLKPSSDAFSSTVFSVSTCTYIHTYIHHAENYLEALSHPFPHFIVGNVKYVKLNTISERRIKLPIMLYSQSRGKSPSLS